MFSSVCIRPVLVELAANTSTQLSVLYEFISCVYSFRKIYFIVLFKCVLYRPQCVYVYRRCAGYLWRPEESFGSSSSGVIGGCELPDMGGRKQTQVLCKKSRCS